MDLKDFRKLLKMKRASIFALVFVVVIITMGISLLNPIKYTAYSRLLVVQNTSNSDSYTVSRSNEYLGNLFSQVAYSGSFFNLVLNSQYKVDRSYFSGNYKEQIELWQKTVATKTIADTGIIEIEVYHSNPDQARLIALAVNDVLMNQNSNYQGGEAVKVSMLDQPILSDYPNKPNLLNNFIYSLVLGFILSIIIIYLYPEFDLRIKKRKRIKRNNSKDLNIKMPTDIKIKDSQSEKIKNIKVETKVNEEKIKEHLFNKNIFETKGDMSKIL